MVKNLSANTGDTKETWVQFLSQKDSLEQEMTTHSNIFAWKMPWAEEPDGLSPWGTKCWTQVSNWTSTTTPCSPKQLGPSSNCLVSGPKFYSHNHSPSPRQGPCYTSNRGWGGFYKRTVLSHVQFNHNYTNYIIYYIHYAYVYAYIVIQYTI